LTAPVEVGSALGVGLLDDAGTRQLWTALTGWAVEDQPDAWDAFEDAVRGSLDASTGLSMRPGGWTIDLSAAAARSAIAAALIAGAMWPLGLDQLPAFVLPAVLPMLIDVRRSVLTRTEKALLLELRLAAHDDLDYPWPAAALYGRLPEHVREQVSPTDFADFLDALVAAGHADPAGYEEYRVRPAGRPAWLRLTVH
jgi:hypothetical protein